MAKKSKEQPRVRVFTVRIDYEGGGMEVMDASAADELGVFGHVANLINLKQTNLSVHRRVKAITIVR